MYVIISINNVDIFIVSLVIVDWQSIWEDVEWLYIIERFFAEKISWFDKELTGRIVNRAVSDVTSKTYVIYHLE